MDMVTLTRLDCAIASAALMRSGLAEAVHHCRHRLVFGETLFAQPLMQRVLADMALDVAAATALAFRLARSFDEAAGSRSEAAFARAMTPVVKYWVCKMAPSLLYEAMECLGGNGYVEEGTLARAYREAPVNAIWEGSGNVMALDVIRVLARGPALFDEVLAGIERDLGGAGNGTVGCSGPPCRWRVPTKARRASSPSSWRCRRRPPSSGAWAQGGSPTPSSRAASPANGAAPTACWTPATTPGLIVDTLYPAAG